MFKKTLLTVLLASGFSMSAAHAVDGTINFTGKILANTCTVDSSSDGQDVNLGVWGADGFTGVGTTQGNTPFNIKLGACDPDLTSTSVTFSTATPDTDNAMLLKLSGATPATGVGIALYEQDGTTQIAPGTATTEVATAGAADVTMNFVAKYMATKDAASITPGDANATADFTINYK